MTSIRDKYRFMERAAWEWWHFMLPPSMGVSDRVLLESSLLSYRTALEAGLHKNLSEIVIPGVLTRYDTPQLMQAIFPRPIFLINPANAMGQELRSRFVEEALSTTFATDKALGKPDRIKLFHRGFGDPLPFE